MKRHIRFHSQEDDPWACCSAGLRAHAESVRFHRWNARKTTKASSCCTSESRTAGQGLRPVAGGDHQGEGLSVNNQKYPGLSLIQDGSCLDVVLGLQIHDNLYHTHDLQPHAKVWRIGV